MALRETLEAKLREKGRLEWLREECDAVAALEPAVRRRNPDAFLSIKGARKLKPRQLAVLRELVAWREARAEETDRPAFKILGSEALMKLAEKRPRTVDDLRHVPGILPRLRRHADELAGRRAAGQRASGEGPPGDPPLAATGGLRARWRPAWPA